MPSATWLGAATGAGLSAAAFVAFTGLQAGTALGWAGDILVSLLLGLGLCIILTLIAWGAILLTRAVPPAQAALVIGLVGTAVLFLALISGPLAFLALLFVLPGTLLGASLGLERERGIRSAPVILVLSAALLVNSGALYLLLTPGSDRHLTSLPPLAESDVPPLALPDPGVAGPFQVANLTYGSGTDRHRPEYGEAVAIASGTVDGSAFVNAWQGWRGRLRSWYWGFGPDNLPINGRVWYPEGAGPFPLVLVVHGNHNMTHFSDPGYAYLGEHLASQGYIAVSVDQNFLNGGFAGDLGGQANAARAWLLLEHLRTWQAWTQDPDNPFYGKADMSKIALIGHSRGGEAAYTAAIFNRLERFPDNANITLDYNFEIQTVVAIAPTDGQYSPANRLAPGADFNYLVLHGAHDGDVSPFLGSRAYQRLTYSGEGYYAKASVYIHGANHGQFNSLWGSRDIPAPLSGLVNLRPIMPPEEQRRAARALISGFMEATLGSEPEYLTLFQDYRRGADWLPQTRYITRFADSTQLTLADYEEDLDVTTATLPGATIKANGLTFWKEQIPFLRKGTSALTSGAVLRWAGSAHYSIELPEELPSGWQAEGPGLLLTLDVADLRSPEEAGEPLDFWISATTRTGQTGRQPLSQYGTLSVPLPTKLYKLGPLEKSQLGEPGPMLQTFSIPLEDILPGLTPADIAQVDLLFDLSVAGQVMVDEIGFRRP